MSKFSAFMAQNVVPVENKKVVISNRFKDEKGNPIEWEIRAITSEQNEELQRKSMVVTSAHRGAQQRELDQFKYTSALLAASVVFPDLCNAELQDSYGVKTPEALLKKMLLPHEESRLAQEVTSFSEIEDFGALAQDAKN